MTANDYIHGVIDNKVDHLLMAQKHIIENNLPWTQPKSPLDFIFYEKPLYSWVDLAYELYFGEHSQSFCEYMIKRDYGWNSDTIQGMDNFKKCNSNWNEYIDELRNMI